VSVRDTSHEAYEYVRKRGITGAQSVRLGQVLYSRPLLTRQELSRASGVAINAVCGRVNELIKAHFIQECGKRPCRITGRTAYVLNIRRPLPKQEQLL